MGLWSRITRLFRKAPENDSELRFVDQYLDSWTRFARGENQFVPLIRDHKELFELSLANLLLAGDRAAASRLVYYAVVQVGGFISLDSMLGMAASLILEDQCPTSKTQDGENYFAGDLYFWWQEHGKNHQPFQLLEEWGRSDFARATVIPMYRSVREQKPMETKADPVTLVSGDDEQMNKAMEAAAKTVGLFVDALRNPDPTRNSFSFKVKCLDGETAEYIWATEVRFAGEKLHGVLNNEPCHVQNVKFGQAVSTEPENVADWMYVENRRLVGGYTIRVLREKMGKEEREKMDRQLPFVID